VETPEFPPPPQAARRTAVMQAVAMQGRFFMTFSLSRRDGVEGAGTPGQRTFYPRSPFPPANEPFRRSSAQKPTHIRAPQWDDRSRTRLNLVSRGRRMIAAPARSRRAWIAR
jgi:hypothetical protein